MNEIASQRDTDLTVTAEQRGFTDTQVAALRQLGLEDVPEPDLAVLFHQAKRTGLDVFARQIYMIGRNIEVDADEVSPETGNTRRVKRRVTRYTIQIGIDGYRLMVRRAAMITGEHLGMEGPVWCGPDGVWRDFWPDTAEAPLAAKFILFRNNEAFPFVAHYAEFVQTRYDRETGGQVPNAMWKKMPANQLAKCAEVGACKRAYPADFAGLVYDGAAQDQVIDEAGNIIVDGPPEHRPARKARGVKALIAAADEANDTEPEAVTLPAFTAAPSTITPAATDEAELEDALNNLREAGYGEPKYVEQFTEPADGALFSDAPDPAPTPVLPEPKEVPAPAKPAKEPGAMSPAMRAKGMTMLGALLGEAEPKLSIPESNAIIAEMLVTFGGDYRVIKDPKHLTDAELKKVVDTLRGRKTKGTLADYIAEGLNAVAIREAAGEGWDANGG